MSNNFGNERTAKLVNGQEMPAGTVVNTVLALGHLRRENPRILRELIDAVHKMEDDVQIELSHQAVQVLSGHNMIAVNGQLVRHVRSVVLVATEINTEDNVYIKNPLEEGESDYGTMERFVSNL